MTRQEVILKARDVVQGYGGQVKAAEKLGVRQPSISKALREGDTSMDALRKEILEKLGGFIVHEETYFAVEPKPARRK